MSGFAAWLAASRSRRVALIAGLFPLPLVGLISGGIVVMSASLRGPREALLDCALALLLLSGVAFVVGMDVLVLVGSAAVSCLVWIGLGAVTGWSRSVTLAVQAAVMVALIALLVLLVVTGDQVAFWSPVLETLYADLEQQGMELLVDIPRQSLLMSSVVIAGSLTGALLALLLGSTWANSVKPVPNASRFSDLRLGYVLGGLAALAGVAELAGLELYGVLLVFGAAFCFQGIAVVAWWSKRLKWPRGWWIGLCILPVLLINILVLELVLFAALGFIDNWYGLRRRDTD